MTTRVLVRLLGLALGVAAIGFVLPLILQSGGQALGAASGGPAVGALRFGLAVVATVARTVGSYVLLIVVTAAPIVLGYHAFLAPSPSRAVLPIRTSAAYVLPNHLRDGATIVLCASCLKGGSELTREDARPYVGPATQCYACEAEVRGANGPDVTDRRSAAPYDILRAPMIDAPRQLPSHLRGLSEDRLRMQLLAAEVREGRRLGVGAMPTHADQAQLRDLRYAVRHLDQGERL